MRIVLICVGRLKAGPERELFGRYFKRLEATARGIGIAGVDLRELRRILARVGRRIGAKRKRPRLSPRRRPGAYLIALDERGEFADERGMGGRNPARARRGPAILRRRDRRPGRAFAVAARQGQPGHQLRRDDLAASACKGDGERATLSRSHHSCRSPLPSRLIAAIPARFDDFGRRHADEAKRRNAMRARRRRSWRRARVAPGDVRRPGRRPAPPASEQQKADKEIELRGVEDTMRASDDQRRAIELRDRIDPRRPGAAFRGAD